jgi:hypothetical protein
MEQLALGHDLKGSRGSKNGIAKNARNYVHFAMISAESNFLEQLKPCKCVEDDGIMSAKTGRLTPRLDTEQGVTFEDQYKQNNELLNGLPHDAFGHFLRNQRFGAWIWLPHEQGISRRLCCQHQRSKCEHNQMHPK